MYAHKKCAKMYMKRKKRRRRSLKQSFHPMRCPRKQYVYGCLNQFSDSSFFITEAGDTNYVVRCWLNLGA